MTNNIDWVKMKQNEIVGVHTGEASLVYNDLVDIDEIVQLEDTDSIHICLQDDVRLNFFKKDLENINGVCIKFKVMQDNIDNGTVTKTYAIPFDKILYICTSHTNK